MMFTDCPVCNRKLIHENPYKHRNDYICSYGCIYQKTYSEDDDSTRETLKIGSNSWEFDSFPDPEGTVEIEQIMKTLREEFLSKFSQNPEKRAFQEAIHVDPYDRATRLVYADWLEENGFDDEAQIQREWNLDYQAAEDYLRLFAIKCNKTLDDLLTKAKAFQEDNEDYMHLDFDTPNYNAGEFWCNFKLFTKQEVVNTDRWISCSC